MNLNIIYYYVGISIFNIVIEIPNMVPVFFFYIVIKCRIQELSRRYIIIVLTKRVHDHIILIFLAIFHLNTLGILAVSY